MSTQNMKTTVIYHSADFDGIFCREIARKFLGDQDVEYIGWNFGDAPLDLKGTQPTDLIIVMDLPMDAPFGLKMHPKAGENMATGFPETLVWIDHHKSAIDSHPKNIHGYRIDGVAACRLAWQWFMHGKDGLAGNNDDLPLKQDYIDRTVSEPLAVRLAGEYDIWDKRDPRAETFQYGLRARDDLDWKLLLSLNQKTSVDEVESLIAVGHQGMLNPDGTTDNPLVVGLLRDGEIAQRYAQRIDASICNSLTWLMEWEGLKFLCVNHARFNSLLFDAKDKPETGHDALLGFRYNGKNWLVSLYHARHRTDLDLSQIAVKFGGGGHKGACGFTCKQLPFSL